MKAQSAIEYLMTYGWMLLVVAIVGGAIFSITSNQGFETSISGFQGLEVQDIGLSQSEGSSFQLANTRAGAAELKEIRYRNSGDQKWYSIPKNTQINPASTEVVSIPQIRVDGDGDREVEMEIKFDQGNLEDMTSTGTINGEISVDTSLKIFEEDTSNSLKNSMVGYWPLTSNYVLDEKALDLEDGNHGSVQGASIEEGMLHFEENDRVEISDSPSLDVGGEITMSVLVNLDEHTTWPRIISKGNYDSYHLRLGDGRVTNFFCGEQDEDCGNDRKSTLSSGSDEVELDTWTHIATTWDGEVTKIFVDGEEVSSTTYENGPLVDSDSSLRIRDAYEYYGHIGHVAVFDYSLNSTEVDQLYQATIE